MENKNKSIILFLYLWLCIGFPLGLWVLLAGPSKWLAEYSHSTNMEISKENILGKVIIIVYIIVAFLLAFFFHRFIKKSENKTIKWFLPGILTLILLASVYVFSFNPKLLINYSGEISTKNIKNQEDKYNQLEFVYGAYPNEEMIKSLKEQGFDGIISLLHEMVIPAEPALMKDESALAKKYGIKLINLPMMPWVSENEKTLQAAKKFIETQKGLYYVHCYLGRDRVNIFKSVAKKFGVKTKKEDPSNIRKIEELPTWTRGNYFKLEKDVYLTPYPTDDEYMMFILNGHFKTVISLLDNNVKDNQIWIAKEKKLLTDYSMNYIHYPLAPTFNQKDLEELKKLINSKEKPILLHGFLTNDDISKFIINHY
ncbi:MAG: hypothetical protein PHC28_15735 [Flavobacterium sp.]|uniref:hypothetical protein n=1 Tax=Flavobacterium sp. TaxID=239 RepID=UPI00261AC841|nr:hypothetical protein [Flavobacterium sp.]MDD5151905.1 hypothetical protein [Flavobacterium sp.]